MRLLKVYNIYNIYNVIMIITIITFITSWLTRHVLCVEERYTQALVHIMEEGLYIERA